MIITHNDVDNQIFASEMESDMLIGTKRLVADLARYVKIRFQGLKAQSLHWRHKESGTVYQIVAGGLAATGAGKLALMVHYCSTEDDHTYPDCTGRNEFVFERQYAFFLEKFEPVIERTEWDRV